MRDFVPEPLFSLAAALKKETGKPLYLIGGKVRDYLAGFSMASSDFDICAPVPAEIFMKTALAAGVCADAAYARTGTVKISLRQNGGNEKNDIKTEAEYAAFRSDKYVRGTHTPAETSAYSFLSSSPPIRRISSFSPASACHGYSNFSKYPPAALFVKSNSSLVLYIIFLSPAFIICDFCRFVKQSGYL